MCKKKSYFRQSEMREAQRLELPFKVEYRLKGKKHSIKAICKDIGGKGIRIFTSRPLKVGDIINVVIHSNDSDSGPFTAQCKVVWKEKTGSDRFDTGLSFTNIDNRDKFIEYLCEKIVNSSLIEDNVYE